VVRDCRKFEKHCFKEWSRRKQFCPKDKTKENHDKRHYNRSAYIRTTDLYHVVIATGSTEATVSFSTLTSMQFVADNNPVRAILPFQFYFHWRRELWLCSQQIR
jgi:ubiquinone biosynthesis protein Coq4